MIKGSITLISLQSNPGWLEDMTERVKRDNQALSSPAPKPQCRAGDQPEHPDRPGRLDPLQHWVHGGHDRAHSRPAAHVYPRSAITRDVASFTAHLNFVPYNADSRLSSPSAIQVRQ
jgi:hypothetical protein